jgi:hypothetical protein
MSLSPNHTNDLVHEQDDSTDRAFEACRGAEVTVSTFDHPDMFSPSALTEAPVGNDDDSDIDCQQVDNTLLMIILQESQEENKDMNDDNSFVVDGEDKGQPSNDVCQMMYKQERSVVQKGSQCGLTKMVAGAPYSRDRLIGTVHMFLLRILTIHNFILYFSYGFVCHMHSSLN